MNNGKAFPNLDGMACSNPWHYQPQFLPRHWQTKKYWISWDLQIPNLLDKNANNSRNNMKSHEQSSHNVVLPPSPKVWEVFLKKSFSQHFRRKVVRLPIFMGKFRYWTLKWHDLRTRQNIFMKSKKIEIY